MSQFFAFASRRPFVSFLASLSALYRGRLRLDPPLRFFLRSSRCLRIVSRDPATAADLGRQGFDKARFGGIPGLDYLAPTGRDLRARDATIVGLLPGSRPPEATRNLHLLMRLARIAAEMMAADASLPRISFRAATVPALLADIPALARTASWTWRAPETLAWSGDGAPAEILCFGDAYADIVDASALVVSMAGLAVDQAVGLGKPAILIPGEGPQHTYRFAEAQSRLLGPSTRVVGAAPATDRELREAARHMFDTVRDRDALSRARAWGLERFGGPGASRRIADMIVAELARAPAYAPH